MEEVIGNKCRTHGIMNITLIQKVKLVFYEIGMAHFPKWTPFFSNRLFDYFDWGIGFKSLAGKEETQLTWGSTIESEGEYRNGYLTI